MRVHQVQGRQAQVRGPRGYRTCTSTPTQRSERQRRPERGSDSLFEQRVSPARRVAFNAVALEVAAPVPSAGRAGPAPAMDAPASAAAAAAEDEDWIPSPLPAH